MNSLRKGKYSSVNVFFNMRAQDSMRNILTKFIKVMMLCHI